MQESQVARPPGRAYRPSPSHPTLAEPQLPPDLIHLNHLGKLGTSPVHSHLAACRKRPHPLILRLWLLRQPSPGSNQNKARSKLTKYLTFVHRLVPRYISRYIVSYLQHQYPLNDQTANKGTLPTYVLPNTAQTSPKTPNLSTLASWHF